MRAVLDVFNVLHEPTAVFERLREKPRVLVPYLVIVVLSVAIAFAMRPVYEAAFRGIIANLPPEQAARVNPSRQVLVIIAITPINIIVMLAIGAGLMWVLTSLTGNEGRYKMLLSVLTHAWITFVVVGVVSALILMTRGVESVTSFQDARPPIGLDLLVPDARGFVGGLLNAINPFSIWGVWLTGLGIAVTHKVGRGTGITVAAVAFLIGASLLALMQSLQGM